MKKTALFIVTIISLIMSFTLTGCWDSIETEKLGLVTLLGIQKTKSNNIKVTVQEIVTKNQTPENQVSISNSKRPFYVYSEEGSTISEALQKISSSQHQKIYLGHTKIIILDEEMVKSAGIDSIIDFYERNLEIRPRTWLLVSEKGTFSKILNINTGVNMDTGSMLEETINNDIDNSNITVKNLNDFIEMLTKPGSEPYTAGISILHQKSSNKLIIKDTAVFRNNKLVGWLKKQKCRGVAFANGEIKGGIITVPFRGDLLSLKILKAYSKIKPAVSNGKMKINLSLNVLSNIAESHSNNDFINKTEIKKLQKLENKTIKSEISSAFYMTQSLNSDVFEFGNYFNMYYPEFWKKIKNDWNSYYQKLQLNVHVNSTIENIGKYYKTLNK